MIIEEQVSLARLTTFKTGGPARYHVTTPLSELPEAISFAQAKDLPWRVLGEGSNVLASDAGYDGVIITIISAETTVSDTDKGVLVVADAGVSWDTFVSYTCSQGWWGIENLAGIPGTVGAAPIQNIGAYGTEVKDTIMWVEVLDTNTHTVERVGVDACAFSYRDSRFKHEPHYVVTRVAFLLSKEQGPQLSYKDLQDAVTRGERLETPEAVADCVRRIRARKFPDLSVYGTAGSFFKNPILTKEKVEALVALYPEIPTFPGGAGLVKIPLAWILDKVLGLRGFAIGRVRAFEEQPLVLVATAGATTTEVDACADDIVRQVHDAVGISIEREVQSL